MSWWVERPARALAALEAAGLGLALTYPLASHLLTSPIRVGRLFLGVVLIVMTPIAVAAFVLDRPDGLRHLLRRARLRWVAPLVVGALFVSGLYDWAGWCRPIGVLSAGCAIAVGAWSFAIAARARGWISGPLEAGDELRVRDGGTTYVLGRVPEGARVGGWLTFPGVELAEAPRGPYRTGRVHGRARAVLRLPRSAIRRRLLAHGLAFWAWAVVCAASALTE